MKPGATSFPTFSAFLQKNRPPYRDYRFWIIQFINLIAFLTTLFTPNFSANYSSFNRALENSFAVHFFVFIFFLTAITSALIFGLRGIIYSVLLVALLTSPKVLTWPTTQYGRLVLARLGIILLMSIATAILVTRERDVRLKVQVLNGKMNEVILEKDRFFKLATEAQENERRRISRDLHDDSLQLLAAVMHQLDGAIDAEDPEKVRAQMLRAKETINHTSDAIRRYCEELRPMLLDSLGLIPSVEWMGQELQKSTGIKIDFETDGEPRPIRNQDLIHIFRVMQEAFHNIERHSKATAVRVTWKYEDDFFEISVTDNGIGMWNFGPAPSRSLGIQGMYERMELIGGKLTIESQPGFGTKVSLSVPFE